jgi:hypothetical protein
MIYGKGLEIIKKIPKQHNKNINLTLTWHLDDFPPLYIWFFINVLSLLGDGPVQIHLKLSQQ